MCSTVAARDVRMEVDYTPLTECKEGGGGARVQVNDSDIGSAADSSMQIDHGQLQISWLEHHLPPLSLPLIDAPVCVLH